MTPASEWHAALAHTSISLRLLWYHCLAMKFGWKICWFGLSVTAFNALGCSGHIGDMAAQTTEGSSGAGRGGSPEGGMGGGVSDEPDPTQLMPLRRLTRFEYNNVVEELLDLRSDVAKSFPGEPTGTSGFSTPGLLSEADFTAYRSAAEDLAARSLKNSNPRVLRACAGKPRDDECATLFVKDFGLRAYRRPLSDREAGVFEGLYKKARTDFGYSFLPAVELVVSAFLQSPGFLYRWEQAPTPAKLEAKLIALDGYEMASRLSFLFWGNMPDSDLFAAAAAGTLQTQDGLQGQARRLLGDPRARKLVANFTNEWLELGDLGQATKDDKTYPRPLFHPAAGSSLQRDVQQFAQRFMLGGPGIDATFKELMTSPVAFIDVLNAGVYGLGTGTTNGDNWFSYKLEQLDPNVRPGLLTRAGFLAAKANAYEGDPIKRGKIVREKLLCQALVPPPGAVPPLPEPQEGLTNRQRHQMHMQLPECSGCHRLMDPIGFAFSRFDAVGAYHESEGGEVIDWSGTVVDLDGKDAPFKDVAGLAAALAQSDEARQCFVKQWLRFALRREEVKADDASLSEIYRSFADSGFQIPELFVALASSDSLRFREAAKGEPLQ